MNYKRKKPRQQVRHGVSSPGRMGNHHPGYYTRPADEVSRELEESKVEPRHPHGPRGKWRVMVKWPRRGWFPRLKRVYAHGCYKTLARAEQALAALRKSRCSKDWTFWIEGPATGQEVSP